MRLPNMLSARPSASPFNPFPAAPAMPEGYADEDGAFYIPDALRPYYSDVSSPTRQEIEDQAERIATAEVATQYREADAADAAKQQSWDKPIKISREQRAADGRSKVAERLQSDVEAYMRKADHQIRLWRAEQEAQNQANTAHILNERRQKETCPVCCELSTTTQDYAGLRVNGYSLTLYTSCLSCHEQIERLRAERRAATRSTETLTKIRDLVETLPLD